MVERLGIKLSYIKHRIHALNIAPYKPDKVVIDNKRPYKDYGKYNYAKEVDEVIGHIKFTYADPDIPFSEWSGYDEVERHILRLMGDADLPAFRCNYHRIGGNQVRKDMFL